MARSLSTPEASVWWSDAHVAEQHLHQIGPLLRGQLDSSHLGQHKRRCMPSSWLLQGCIISYAPWRGQECDGLVMKRAQPRDADQHHY